MKRLRNNFKYWRWYGFDLDGTIADNSNHAFGYGNIGKPIKKMTNLMKRLHKKGYWLKIVTARVGDVGESKKAQEKLKEHIWEWCDVNLGFRPEITDRKDASMECLYDDRARQVIRNKGEDMQQVARDAARALDALIWSGSTINDAISVRNKCRRLGLI